MEGSFGMAAPADIILDRVAAARATEITAVSRELKAQASLEMVSHLARIFQQNVTTDLPMTKMVALAHNRSFPNR